MNDLKQERFEEYLEEVCFEEYPEVLDDDRPDFFDAWLTGLSVADYLRHGDEFINKAITQEKKRIKKILDEKIVGKGKDEMFDQGAYEENRQIYKAIES